MAIYEDASSNSSLGVSPIDTADNTVVGECRWVFVRVKPRFSDNKNMWLMLKEELI